MRAAQNKRKNMTTATKEKTLKMIEMLSAEMPVEQLQGKPLSRKVKTIEIGGAHIAEIKKENLSLPSCQRPLDIKRAQFIHDNWNAALGIIHVCVVEEDKKFKYYILDGQHRANGNPNEKCVCIVHEEKPHKVFLQANDPAACKPLNWDDRFWANFYGEEEHAQHLYTTIEEADLQPTRTSQAKEGDFAGMGIVFKIMESMKAAPKKRGRKTEQQKIEDEQKAAAERRAKFDYLIELMFELFDPQDFKKTSGAYGSSTGYQTIWTAFGKMINNNSFWQYRPKKITKKLASHIRSCFENQFKYKLTPANMCSFAAQGVSQQKFARDIISDFMKESISSYQFDQEIKTLSNPLL